MAKRSLTVRQLAQEAELDIDEVLVRLWESGLESVTDGNDPIRRGDQVRARRALGVPTRRDYSSPAFWADLFHMDSDRFVGLLNELEVRIRPGASRLPKGAIKKLKAAAARLGLMGATPEAKSPSDRPPAPPTFEWRVIGHERDVRALTAEDVIKIHHALAEDFRKDRDPIEPAGVKDRGILESAVSRATTSLGDTLKYPSIEMASAALMHSLVLNHPFHNGNKRTALVSMLVMLDENGVYPEFDEDDLFKYVILIAQHRVTDPHAYMRADREVLAIADWISQNTRRLVKGERPLAFRQLRQILSAYGCTLEHPRSVGNRMNIYRTVRSKSFLGMSFPKNLSTQIANRGEGAEVERNTINKVRADLHLDDEHGVDSEAFYNQDTDALGDFIVRYRKTLKRLARV